MLCAPNNPVVAVLLSLVEIGTIQSKDWIAPHDALLAPALSVAANIHLLSAFRICVTRGPETALWEVWHLQFAAVARLAGKSASRHVA